MTVKQARKYAANPEVREAVRSLVREKLNQWHSEAVLEEIVGGDCDSMNAALEALCAGNVEPGNLQRTDVIQYLRGLELAR